MMIAYTSHKCILKSLYLKCYDLCHFMYTYVGRDNKLLHCIVPLPTPPGAVPVQSFGAKQVRTDKPYDHTQTSLSLRLVLKCSI